MKKKKKKINFTQKNVSPAYNNECCLISYYTIKNSIMMGTTKLFINQRIN